LKKFKNKL